jgi:ABC-type uncharacterized transport system involved in gliding motility auxiliary subunit
MGVDQSRFNATVEPTSSLETMWIIEAGSFTVADNRGYEVTPLIQTTERAGTMQAMMLSFLQPADISKQFKPEGGKRTIAAVVQGSFKSAFPLGAPPEEKSDENSESAEEAAGDADAGEAAEAAPAAPALSESAKPSTLVLIADTDFLWDQVSVQRIPQLNAYMPRNDNLAFSTNIVDYVAGSEDLIGIRSKGRSQRPFNVIVRMQEAAQEEYQAAIAAVEQRLADTQQELNKLVQEQNATQQLVLTPEMSEKIDNLRAAEAAARAERRDIRRQLREGVESLENRLTALNLLLVPIGVIAIGISYFVTRHSRRKPA